MKKESLKEPIENYNIYSLHQSTNKSINRKRIIVTVAILVAFLVMLTIIAIYTTDTLKRLKQAKAYEAQVISYQQELEKQEQQKRLEEEKKKQERMPKLTETGKEKLKHIYGSDKKRAFLTFDDGPSSNTSPILSILQERNIKATFFMLGSRVEAMPDTVKKVFDQGHFIANHGYSHVYSQIYACPENVLDEYNRTNTAIQKAIGEPDFNSHLFRFPGGLVGGKYAEIKQQAKQLLEQNDILNVDWNSLTGDAERQNPTPDQVVEGLKRTSQGKNSIVILMHDAQAKQITVETLPQVIDYLIGEGYEFQTFFDVLT
jgi:peptidoglycan/xylan/chitin deacetylase (PgdA/CDA1 family)